jgi:hypothetical protein
MESLGFGCQPESETVAAQSGNKGRWGGGEEIQKEEEMLELDSSRLQVLCGDRVLAMDGKRAVLLRRELGALRGGEMRPGLVGLFGQ